MGTQALSLPVDITWQRLAYSRDMTDTSFGQLAFPPKWRSSLAVYGHLVPEEQTAESYPDARILYLRLTCSITGWNPSEGLRSAVDLTEIGDQLDDLQRSTWEAIQAQGWSKTYWPCLGAIAQVAVYPGRDDGQVGVDDFPFIVDFEPKKRELYETATSGGEFLSGSSEKLSVQKGTTNLDHTEKSARAGFSGFGISAGASIEKAHDQTTVDNRTTDSSREDRETKSFTTTFSQMYQLFNGYHLATNRALFVVAPRPHTVSDQASVEFNLIDGERKLEGIQEMFLVIQLPKQLQGVCLQASLDTGHDVVTGTGVSYMAPIDDDPLDIPVEDGPFPPPDPLPPPPPGGIPGGIQVRRIVVTRRLVRNCLRLDPDDRLVSVGAPDPLPDRDDLFPPVVFEGAVLQDVAPTTARSMVRSRRTEATDRVALANYVNLHQRRVVSTMVSGFSAGGFRPRSFLETTAFRRLAGQSLAGLGTNLAELTRRGVIDPELARDLEAQGIRSLGDLFRRGRRTAPAAGGERLIAARERVIDFVLTAAQPARR